MSSTNDAEDIPSGITRSSSGASRRLSGLSRRFSIDRTSTGTRNHRRNYRRSFTNLDQVRREQREQRVQNNNNNDNNMDQDNSNSNNGLVGGRRRSRRLSSIRRKIQSRRSFNLESQRSQRQTNNNEEASEELDTSWRRRLSEKNISSELQQEQEQQEQQLDEDDELLMMKVVAARMDILGISDSNNEEEEEEGGCSRRTSTTSLSSKRSSFSNPDLTDSFSRRTSTTSAAPSKRQSLRRSLTNESCSSLRGSNTSITSIGSLSSTDMPEPPPMLEEGDDPVMRKILAERSQSATDASIATQRRSFRRSSTNDSINSLRLSNTSMTSVGSLVSTSTDVPEPPFTLEEEEDGDVVMMKILAERSQSAALGRRGTEEEKEEEKAEEDLDRETHEVPEGVRAKQAAALAATTAPTGPAPNGRRKKKAPSLPGAFAVAPSTGSQLRPSRGLLGLDSERHDRYGLSDGEESEEEEDEELQNSRATLGRSSRRSRASSESRTDALLNSLDAEDLNELILAIEDGDLNLQDLCITDDESDCTEARETAKQAKMDPASLKNAHVEKKEGEEEEPYDDSPTRFSFVLAAGMCLLAIVAVIVIAAKPSFIYGVEIDDDASTRKFLNSREEALNGLLKNLTHPTLQLLEDPNSPQAAALEWLSADPALLHRPTWRLPQRYALATIFYSLNGPEWPLEDQEHWLSYEVEDECDWTAKDLCTSEGQYRKLELGQIASLEGELPQEIHLLTGLQEISISGMPQNIWLKDLLPNSLASLPDLQVIDLSLNNFEGSTLPTQLGLLTQLEQLKIDAAHLHGSIPSEVMQMGTLDTLQLAQNSLTGSLIPEWSNHLTKLGVLWLYENQLTGTLPAEWAHMPFHSLSMRKNNLTGTMPPEWSDMSTIIDLRLSYNDLSGTFPPEWVVWKSIKSFGIEKNDQLSGTIPANWCSRRRREEIDFWVDCDNFLCCWEATEEFQAQMAEVAETYPDQNNQA